MIEGAAVFKSAGWYVRATESLEAVKLQSGRPRWVLRSCSEEIQKHRNPACWGSTSPWDNVGQKIKGEREL